MQERNKIKKNINRGNSVLNAIKLYFAMSIATILAMPESGFAQTDGEIKDKIEINNISNKITVSEYQKSIKERDEYIKNNWDKTYMDPNEYFVLNQKTMFDRAIEINKLGSNDKLNKIRVLLKNKFNKTIGDNPIEVIKVALQVIATESDHKDFSVLISNLSDEIDLNMINTYGYIQTNIPGITKASYGGNSLPMIELSSETLNRILFLLTEGKYSINLQDIKNNSSDKKIEENKNQPIIDKKDDNGNVSEDDLNNWFSNNDKKEDVEVVKEKQEEEKKPIKKDEAPEIEKDDKGNVTQCDLNNWFSGNDKKEEIEVVEEKPEKKIEKEPIKKNEAPKIKKDDGRGVSEDDLNNWLSGNDKKEEIEVVEEKPEEEIYIKEKIEIIEPKNVEEKNTEKPINSNTEQSAVMKKFESEYKYYQEKYGTNTVTREDHIDDIKNSLNKIGIENPDNKLIENLLKLNHLHSISSIRKDNKSYTFLGYVFENVDYDKDLEVLKKEDENIKNIKALEDAIILIKTKLHKGKSGSNEIEDISSDNTQNTIDIVNNMSRNADILSQKLDQNKLNNISYKEIIDVVSGFNSSELQKAFMYALLDNDVVYAQKLMGMDLHCSDHYPNYISKKILGKNELKKIKRLGEIRRYMQENEIMANKYIPQDVKNIYKNFVNGIIDNKGLPYNIISKTDMKLYLFSDKNILLARQNTLLGKQVGDQKNVKTASKTTPGGMYQINERYRTDENGRNLFVEYNSHYITLYPIEGQYDYPNNQNYTLGVHGVYTKQKDTRLVGIVSADRNSHRMTAGCPNIMRDRFGGVYNQFKLGAILYVSNEPNSKQLQVFRSQIK